MKVTCDSCGKDFYNLVKQETKHIDGNEIIHTYIQCPNCKTKYSICYDDISTLVLKKQIRKHTRLLGCIKDKKQYDEKVKDVRKKQNRLERETNILEAKYHKYFF